MKTLADLKRRIKPGTEMTLVASTGRHVFLNVRRVVTRAQVNSFAQRPIDPREGTAESWLDYGKASEYTFYPDEPDKFTTSGLTYVIHN